MDSQELTFNFSGIPSELQVGDSVTISTVDYPDGTLFEWYSNGDIDIDFNNDKAKITPKAPGQIRVNVKATLNEQVKLKYFYLNVIDKMESIIPIVSELQTNLARHKDYEILIKNYSDLDESKLVVKFDKNKVLITTEKGKIKFKAQANGKLHFELHYDDFVKNFDFEIENYFTPITKITSDTEIKVYNSLREFFAENGDKLRITMDATNYVPKLIYVKSDNDTEIFHYKICAIKSDLNHYLNLIG